jgi:hypothetical protein
VNHDAEQKYFWCLNHSRVESETNACGWSDRLGPYATESQAQQTLQLVAQRNKEADAEDEA